LLEQGGTAAELQANRFQFQRFLAPFAICDSPFAIGVRLLLTFTLIGLLSGCSKGSSSSQSTTPQSFNLGSIELTYSIATRQIWETAPPVFSPPSHWTAKASNSSPTSKSPVKRLPPRAYARQNRRSPRPLFRHRRRPIDPPNQTVILSSPATK
jgi:hypothetical protein